VASARIRLLGPFEVMPPGGLPLAFPTRKAEALLARLARRPGDRASRAHLAGLLWPDRPDEQGRASLRQALAAVRRLLADAGAEGPTTGGDAVSLPSGGVEVDVALLEQALTARPLDADRVVALCRGPFLAGFPPVVDTFDAWVEAERAELTRRLLELMRPALAAADRDGRDGHGDAEAARAALAVADAALALDPAHEPAYRARMAVLARAGDRAAALREYERCRAALAREVGVGPGAETEALRRALTTPSPRPAGASAARTAPSLAVLPFETTDGEPRHALFARGLSEELVGALSRFRGLRVIARGSVERFTERASDGVETGRLVGAGYLLSTSVRGAGARLRLSLRLLEAATSRAVWSERMDVSAGDLEEAFRAQERIARSVAAALALEIDAAEVAGALRRPPDQLEAYECWLRGQHELRRGTPEADLAARRLFERALELAPGFARAYSGLSLSWFNDWSCLAWERWDETERRAYEYALEAARLDDRDHLTHWILGRILLYRREFDRGLEHLRRAVALNPSDADALANLCLGNACCGDPEQAIALEDEVRLVHPFHPVYYYGYFAMGRFVAQRPRETIERLERAAEATVDGRGFLAAAYAHAGEAALARENARRFEGRFAEHIAAGQPVEPSDPVRWMLRVNPFRREVDQAYLLEGLARAGLAVP
jgi:DNA-binding SARP family transcriptional activator